MSDRLDRLARALGERGRRDEPLAAHTSMRVGGPAGVLAVCHTAEEVTEAVALARSYGIAWRVLGGGCNVLVSDVGIGGLTVLNLADGVRVAEEGEVRAEAGAQMAALAQVTIGEGLAGLEWAAGLPGTVGGAIVGNAGAFDGDVAAVLTSATVLTPEGRVVERPGEWFEFEYRGSRLKRCAQDARHVVLEGVFGLQAGDRQALKARGAEILRWRRERHPSGATMGSTFENPPGEHAGHLIEQAGLKGYRLGSVEVSEQHANFLINTGGATASDVLTLIRHVQDVVEDQTGIRLQLEVELLGEWPAADVEGVRGSGNE